MKYLSTCISGLQEPAGLILKQNIPDVNISNIKDGLILYETEVKPVKISNLTFLNNSYLVFKKFENTKNKNINHLLKSLLKNWNWNNLKKITQLQVSNNSFRLVASRENELISLDNKLKKQLERKISSITKLKVDRGNPDFEFWILKRRDNTCFFMLRITYPTKKEKQIHKGELRPELAHIMCFLSEPEIGDILLDPFAGYGAIPLAGALSFPFEKIYAVDKDKQKIRNLQQRLKKQKKSVSSKIYPQIGNAHKLNNLDSNSIDKIVTDPPWGLYENLPMNISKFYFLMLIQFLKKLKENGIIILLTARKKEFDLIVSRFKKKLQLMDRYDILVSGKKASIYKLKRKKV
ncbi:MAG: RsmD family RNA methyltransferase [Halanaerobiaceae bacterium]